MPTDEAKSRWRRNIAKDYRSVGFCIITGFALAPPVGFVLFPESVRETIPAPDTLRWIIFGGCISTMVLLPIWTLAVLRYRHPLFWLGILISIVLAMLVLLPQT